MNERYLTIARDIRRLITTGVYPVGSAVPGRLALAKIHETTRGTIDRTIRFLVDQGVLESRHGAGTFVHATLPPMRVAVIGLMSGFPQCEGLQFVGFERQVMSQKSERDKLRQFDALIWYLPTAEVRQWAAEFSASSSGSSASIVQIMINRDYPEYNFVTTDHSGAYAEITAERLEKHPQAVPVFIRSQQDHYVIDKRLEGFSRACRQATVPFEVVQLVDDFDLSVRTLDHLQALCARGPLLLFAGSLQVTGCVMAWVRASGLRWREQVWYVDMDNQMTKDVFGVQVTTFIQDYAALMNLAAEKIQGLMSKECHSVQLLVKPRRIEGDT